MKISERIEQFLAKGRVAVWRMTRAGMVVGCVGLGVLGGVHGASHVVNDIAKPDISLEKPAFPLIANADLDKLRFDSIGSPDCRWTGYAKFGSPLTDYRPKTGFMRIEVTLDAQPRVDMVVNVERGFLPNRAENFALVTEYFTFDSSGKVAVEQYLEKMEGAAGAPIDQVNFETKAKTVAVYDLATAPEQVRQAAAMVQRCTNQTARPLPRL
jgi:hypothetical protein